MIKKTIIIISLMFLLISARGFAQQLPDCSTVPLGSPCKNNGNVPANPIVPQLILPQTDASQQKITAEQKKAIDDVIQQKGGVLTPDAVEALKNRPEFQGLTPQEILQGKEMLEKKDLEKRELEKKEQARKEAETKIPGAVQDRKTLGEMEEKTVFERVRNIGKYQEISTDLKPFGYDFFQESAIKVVTDRKDIPVSGDYTIGPGDEVKILLWGRVNANYNLVVDRNGNITVPQIGPIPVAGLTFEQMSKHLIKQAEQFVGANIDVTMGALKSIQVFVLGDVKRAGAYTIGSFATITDALLIAGGPNGIGTMRNIQLRRKDRIITTFDLYDLLLKGDKSKDTILQPGDVVFVPVAGPIVGIAGNVKRPAIYELKEKHDLNTLFELAGGIIPTAYTQQIQVERIIKNERQIVVDIDDKHLIKAKDFHLQDIDLVKIFNIVEGEKNVVFVNGNVKRPGKYEYKPGMRIRDIIKDHLDLLSETYLEYALLVRLEPPALERRLVPFNLGNVLSGEGRTGDLELKPLDQIFIFSKWFFKDKPSITVEGEVRKAGKFSLDKNTNVKDAILMAGDVTKNAYLQKGEIYRTGKKREIITIYFSVGRALEGDPENNLFLQDEDRIVVHSLFEYEYQKIVSVYGDVLKPGNYKYAQGATVKDLIFAAGNILESAYLDEAEITSQIVEDDRIVKLEYKNINLRRALQGDPADNVVLKPYDRLTVKKLQDWRRENFVNVGGEVRYPGRYIIKKNERLSSLIERAGGGYEEYIRFAGGYSRYADTSNVFVMKVDGSARKLPGSVNWNPFQKRWELGVFTEGRSEIEAGDSIVVPEKLERTAWMRELKDITQIFANVGLTAASIAMLYQTIK